MKKLLFTLLAATSTPLFAAAEYPAALQGSYAGAENNDKKACETPLVVVKKDARYDIADAECKPTKINSQGSQLIIFEKCVREGSNWNQTAYFDMGAVITLTEQSKYQGRNTLKLRACGAPAPQPGTAAAAAKTCAVVQGQAGVATYFDDKLSKLATDPIRDFDGYTFKAEKVVTVNKVKLLVGKLIRADGSTGRGTYAIEDEWTCK